MLSTKTLNIQLDEQPVETAVPKNTPHDNPILHFTSTKASFLQITKARSTWHSEVPQQLRDSIKKLHYRNKLEPIQGATYPFSDVPGLVVSKQICASLECGTCIAVGSTTCQNVLQPSICQAILYMVAQRLIFAPLGGRHSHTSSLPFRTGEKSVCT